MFEHWRDQRLSGQRCGLGFLMGVGVLGLAASALAHPDDPKVLDKLPRYEGPGWSAARAGREDGVVSNAAALGFASQGVQLRSWLSLSDFGSFSSANDCWGYTSPSGREYAIIGLNSATAFVEITDPDDPQIVAMLSGPNSMWRDIKVYQNFAYSVSEGGNGIQVFSLAQIDSGIVTLVNTVTTGGGVATHNVAINEASGYLYRCGGGSNGIRAYRLTNFPEGGANPQYVGAWSTKYVHDVQVVSYTEGPYAGREIAFCCSGFNGGFVETGLTILDVTNKANMVVLGELIYPQGAYSHQGWLTADRQHFLLDDELDGQTNGSPSRTHVIDVSDLSNPTYQGFFTNGNTAATHNLYTRDNLMFAANYRSGLRVFDISDPFNGEEIAFFDTFPDSDSANFNGLWSNYPYFPSGTVIGSDIERGLFVWTIDLPPFAMALVEGEPSLISPGGDAVAVSIEPARDGSIEPGSPTLFYSVDGGEYQSSPMVHVSGAIYHAVFPALPCLSEVSWYVSAAETGGGVQTLPHGAPGEVFQSVVASGRGTLFVDEMEVDGGWVSGEPDDDATSGHWVRVVPIGTAAQPGQDHTPDGEFCWVTGQGSVGGSVGEADVDNGKTTLTSPVMSALSDDPNAGDAYLVYHRWYSNNMGANPGVDSMPVLISNDDGASWVELELVTENAGAWVKRAYRIADFVTPTATMRVRFVARDIGPQAVVEAAVDDVEIYFFACETGQPLFGDLDGSCTVDADDLGILLGAFGSSAVGDLNGDGTTDADDLGLMLGAFGSSCAG